MRRKMASEEARAAMASCFQHYGSIPSPGQKHHGPSFLLSVATRTSSYGNHVKHRAQKYNGKYIQQLQWKVPRQFLAAFGRCSLSVLGCVGCVVDKKYIPLVVCVVPVLLARLGFSHLEPNPKQNKCVCLQVCFCYFHKLIQMELIFTCWFSQDDSEPNTLQAQYCKHNFSLPRLVWCNTVIGQ